MHQFFKSHHFAVGILPIPGALHLMLLYDCAWVGLPRDCSPDLAELACRRASQPAAPDGNMRPGSGDFATALHSGTHVGVD